MFGENKKINTFKIDRNARNGLNKVHMFNEWYHFPVGKNGEMKKQKMFC